MMTPNSERGDVTSCAEGMLAWKSVRSQLLRSTSPRSKKPYWEIASNDSLGVIARCYIRVCSVNAAPQSLKLFSAGSSPARRTI